jgi:hypothetical protein
MESDNTGRNKLMKRFTDEEYGKYSQAVSALSIEVSVVQNTSLASNN